MIYSAFLLSAWRGIIARKGTGERIPCAYLKPAKWNGTIVLWADPKGISAILNAAGEPTPAAARMLDSGALILGLDEFMSDTFKRPTPLGNPVGMRNNYSAYANAYERTTLANRVHDLLTAMALARGMDGVKSLRVVGIGEAGVQAALATALAGEAVDRAAIDLAGFDFDSVMDDRSPYLLPGAVKYGGIYGFATLCTGPNLKTLLTAASNTGNFALAAKTKGLTLDQAVRSPDELVTWVLQ